MPAQQDGLVGAGLSSSQAQVPRPGSEPRFRDQVPRPGSEEVAVAQFETWLSTMV